MFFLAHPIDDCNVQSEFEELNLQIFTDSMKKPIIIDCTGKINPNDAKAKGIIFKGIGRG